MLKILDLIDDSTILKLKLMTSLINTFFIVNS